MSRRKRSYYEEGPLAKVWGKLFPTEEITEENMPDRETLEYLSTSYPANHNYLLKQGKLLPLKKLDGRYKDITPHYPKGMNSLLDLACSKGYFNFDAVTSFGCERSMGIDVMKQELASCAAVKKYLGDEVTNFEEMRLHELAPIINDFGGPFDSALVINCYQYLYFGSEYFNECYMSHDKIFHDLREVCSGRVIFSNRIEVEHLQDYPAEKANGPLMIEKYDDESVFAAASKYFTVTRVGKLGRYPIWTLDVL